MIIAFTGPRTGMSTRQQDSFTEIITTYAGYHFTTSQNLLFFHGGCNGSDIEARDIALACKEYQKIDIECFPGDKDQYENNIGFDQEVHDQMPYLWRNKNMVNACNILIATPQSLVEELRSGTWSTIRYARKIKKPCLILDR